MGCDGGSIAKRHEVTRSKKDENRTTDSVADVAARWQFCALSGLKLREPIVSCQLGRLYNKDAILEYLLESRDSKSKDGYRRPSAVQHIRSLKDVKDLKFKTPEPDREKSGSSTNSECQPVCPITGLEMNGKHKFCFILSCGCVVSHKAIERVPSDERCLSCGKQFDPKMDIITINGDKNDVELLRGRMLALQQSRKVSRHSYAGDKKRLKKGE